ncbi:MAG: hypothetical protein KAJ90_03020, partial [Desulfobacterales bacterium]|nr:hypothetical protein [Desulfobacterales bacterium]
RPAHRQEAYHPSIKRHGGYERMSPDKTPPHKKFDEPNHVEKTLINQLLGWTRLSLWSVPNE